MFSFRSRATPRKAADIPVTATQAADKLFTDYKLGDAPVSGHQLDIGLKSPRGLAFLPDGSYEQSPQQGRNDLEGGWDGFTYYTVDSRALVRAAEKQQASVRFK